MILNLTQIIVVFLVIIGFSITVYLVVKNLKNKCSGTDQYNEENKRCQPVCDKDGDYPYYDSDSNTCMECSKGETKGKDGICGKCTSNETHCGDKCYNTDTQKCVNNIVCLESDSDSLCGDQCYDPKTQRCFSLDDDTKILCKINESVCDDKCYDTGKQTCDVDSHTLCDKDKSIHGTKCCRKDQRAYNDVCINCDKELCGGTCCNDKEFCTGGICCKKGEINAGGICCKKGEIKADGICCKSGQINCKGKCCDGKCCDGKCCNQECCGSICCDSKDDVNYSCVKGKCCPTDKVYNDKNGDPMCCDGDDKVISKDGKSCVISCGNDECHLDTQFCASVKDKDGNSHYSCANKKGCSKSAIGYDPILTNDGKNIVDKHQTPIPFCKVSIDGVDKYYTVRNSPGVSSPLNRESFYTLGEKCIKGDCLNTISEKGDIFIEYNEKTKKCISKYDCDTLLPDQKYASDDVKCPITIDGSFTDRCCVDKDGKVTGQICPEGYFCENGECITGYIFDKSKNSKDCVTTTNTEIKEKKYTSLGECRNKEVKNMIKCPVTKNPVWKYNKPFCWNNSLPTICWVNKNWNEHSNPYLKTMEKSRCCPKDDGHEPDAWYHGNKHSWKHNGIHGTKCSTKGKSCPSGYKKLKKKNSGCFAGSTTMCANKPDLLKIDFNIVEDPNDPICKIK